ncbi:nuclear transport factor 2 family protein [Nitratireductor sp. ZSWI3]|uniref:nuclear transport factor 2 family protein n=1 Tax=Nitratireductor sp. ZSWI3 TaxID=2966359 RepID=UPI00215017E5|nr:nuclear transport factor 2 family protein [Nitratireductor sp. ZSWI3]MCR4265052.1 nuclear transport factor 2 family protein [Nitratireductor sp. ZSWI3]
MKTAILLSASTILMGAAMAKAEVVDIRDRQAIVETITDIAAGADRHQWDRVQGAFAETVTLDYTSLWGGEPTRQSRDEVIAQWSSFLPGFDQTLHLVTNHTIIEYTGESAIAEADFQAAHSIEDQNWVLLGHYRYELVKVEGDWKVRRLIMTRTHEMGDRGLVEKAAERTRSGN